MPTGPKGEKRPADCRGYHKRRGLWYDANAFFGACRLFWGNPSASPHGRIRATLLYGT